MKRRTLLLGAAGAGLLFAKPWDRGGPYGPYFQTLNDELRKNGPMRPCLVVDLDRLDENIDVLTKSIQSPKAFRVVTKSLPSLPLIGYVLERGATNRVMCFHQPFLNRLVEAFPQSDVLLGKPMPVRSAEIFYRELRGPFDPTRQLQWLIDTPGRAAQYLALARGLGTKLRISVELDVGLHRGGVNNNQDLANILGTIEAHDDFLELAGFMGYEPHVVKLPRILGTVEEHFAKALGIYKNFLEFTRSEYPLLWRDDLVRNGAGSPTYRLHSGWEIANDLSVGSAIVKPTDFDMSTLAPHVPASFIATPVLKALDGVTIPGLEKLSPLFVGWNPNRERTFFLYGGYWKARLESPPGLATNPLFGRSTNQEMVNGSRAVNIEVDDHVFLRPTQSESVFLQFGDLVVIRGGRIVDSWPVIPAGTGREA